MTTDHGYAPAPDDLAPLEEKLARVLDRLAEARPFAKARHVGPALDVARRMLAVPGGLARLAELAPRFETAGLFAGTDWASPQTLLPSLVGETLRTGSREAVTLEILSELRLLAVAEGRFAHPGMAPEAARHFLTQMLALNLGRLLGAGGEAERIAPGALPGAVDALLALLLERLGPEDLVGHLVDEVWRILDQRPVVVAPVKAMITQIAVATASGRLEAGTHGQGADRLISALFGPTLGCRDDPGLAVHAERLAAMDEAALRAEAQGFARAMHDTGLVSDYHAAFLRWIVGEGWNRLVPAALGLGETGLDGMRCFEDLVLRLIREAVHPETAQCVLGLSGLLERGILHIPPVTASLWRQIGLGLSDGACDTLARAFGPARAPREHLLAGLLQALGQPLGIAQGNNPTCQSARAISLWAYNDPDYLLHLVAEAARHDCVTMTFEGEALCSADLPHGLARSFALDTDPVSLVLVPHLDRIYAEMGRRCAGRGGDPHRWANPELHGWWVARRMCLAVDVATGALSDYEDFLRRFFGSYHPEFNGGAALIHPQPAGIAVTDGTGAFVGWHAITIIRVAPDQGGAMRVYFYNPNNDSGQDWGRGVRVSTARNGERFGEASLPFEAFASRLYLFHDVGSDAWEAVRVPDARMAAVRAMAAASWAAARVPPAEAVAAAAAAPG